MVAMGVNDDGYREVIGTAEGFTESAEYLREFLSRLKSCGLHGVRVHRGQGRRHGGFIAEVFPNAAYQRCTVRFYRNTLAKVPKSKRAGVAAMLNEAQGDRQGREGRPCGDPDPHEVPPQAPAAYTHKQRHRETQPQDARVHARGRHLPGRQGRPHARGREAQLRRGELLELEALSGRVAAPDGGPRRAIGKCTRILTTPMHADYSNVWLDA